MNESATGSTYAGAGVNYEEIDPAKLHAQRMARTLPPPPGWLKVLPLEVFRGESASVMKLSSGDHIAHVEEGLGTAVCMADFLYKETGDPSGYSVVGVHTVAMIVNDMITVGVPPVSLQMHLAAEDGKWLADMRRIGSLFEGWTHACWQAGAAWTGGETPVLKDIVVPGTGVVAGSAVGYLPAPFLPVSENIAVGDMIVGIASSGVHANGISLIRRTIAPTLSDNGLDFFRQALVPTPIYVQAVTNLIQEGIIPSYLINVTGHGLRKTMRAKGEFTYDLTNLPPIPLIFHKIQELGGVAPTEMWGNYNMGVGFMVIVRPKDTDRTLTCIAAAGHKAQIIGVVEKGPKQVLIRQHGVEFKAQDLALR